MRKIFYLFMITGIFVSGCKKDKTEPTTEVPIIETPISTEPIGPLVSDRKANLNIIYFIPKDVTPPADYESRLSTLMLWTQDWVKTQMGLNGYPNKTFGLFVNTNRTRVKITVIKAANGVATYPYSGGSGAVMKEVNAHWAAHPEDKSSEHTLIIMPRTKLEPNGDPLADVPFYGIGKTCFALDYEGLKISNMGRTDYVGDTFSKWFGGLVHELGHGLNLPHNSQKVSDNGKPLKGMALMNAGNYTLGKSPTFLTASDAATLNVNQIFNIDEKIYYGSASSKITSVHAEYSLSKKAIVFSGKFTANVKVNNVLYYNDPNVSNEGTGVNKDYNAVSWENKPIGTDSFYVEMPVSDFFYKDGNPYELKAKFVHENGSISETIYNYEFINNIPFFSFSSKFEISKVGWSIASFSSEEAVGEGPSSGFAKAVIDGAVDTFWHSRWSSAAANYPHQLTINMGSLKSIAGVKVTNRVGLSRAVKEIEVFISVDGVTFTSEGSYVKTNTEGEQSFPFSSQKTARYFKVVAKSSWDASQFAALAEISAFSN